MIDSTLAFIILLEVLFTLFIAWGIMHEEKFVAFEDKIKAIIKAKIKARCKGR